LSTRSLRFPPAGEAAPAFRILSLLSLILISLSTSCGGGDAESQDSEGTVSLYAGKEVSIQFVIPSEEFADSLRFHDGRPAELLLRSESLNASMSAMLVPGCGSSAADRMLYLAEAEVKNLDTSLVDPPGEVSPFTAVVYVRGDSSVVERVWDRGAGELAVLQARSRSASINMLLTSLAGILSTAETRGPEETLTRGVYLSDRTRDEIVEEVNADVDLPPEIHHRMIISLRPSDREMGILDTLTVDFGSTQSDSQLAVYVPRCEGGTSFQALTGSVSNRADSVVCTADSTRLFRGVYSGDWNGFHSSTSETITGEGMRIDRTVSFQCGMWFYPGCGIPASYDLSLSVPEMLGYEVYAPLDETGRALRDSVLTVSYRSPGGGVSGPLAWAAGGFVLQPLAAGRSLFVCSDPDSTDADLVGLAEELASFLWRQFGYEGARLDFVVVSVLDFPVLVTGPGCVFISRDMMEGLLDHSGWTGSIRNGTPVPSTAVVFETARAFLSGSTHLSTGLRDALSAWAVCRFMAAGPEDMEVLLEALRKYYLYSTHTVAATEHAIADPLLEGSVLYDPVVLGKAPAVLEFLAAEIPSFERAVPRALGSLRHSGDPFGRLFSALGVLEGSRYGEMYFRWMYGPGIPLLRVEWSDSSGVLEMMLTQLQPGQEFPLGSATDYVTIHTESGTRRLETLQGHTQGYYTAEIPEIPERILAIDLDPQGLLPADVVYRRVQPLR